MARKGFESISLPAARIASAIETLPLSDVVTITRQIGSTPDISFVFRGQNREPSGARHGNLERSAAAGTLLNLASERSLPTAAQFDRQIVDHASVASRLARDAEGAAND
jgi:hypothetical protein